MPWTNEFTCCGCLWGHNYPDESTPGVTRSVLGSFTHRVWTRWWERNASRMIDDAVSNISAVYNYTRRSSSHCKFSSILRHYLDRFITFLVLIATTITIVGPLPILLAWSFLTVDRKAVFVVYLQVYAHNKFCLSLHDYETTRIQLERWRQGRQYIYVVASWRRA